jgi:hypothetical protein
MLLLPFDIRTAEKRHYSICDPFSVLLWRERSEIALRFDWSGGLDHELSVRIYKTTRPHSDDNGGILGNEHSCRSEQYHIFVIPFSFLIQIWNRRCGLSSQIQSSLRLLPLGPPKIDEW